MNNQNEAIHSLGENFENIENFEKPKVLLIEDDRSIRRIVKAEIKPHCSYLDSETVSNGVSMFTYHKPDLVFLDINLPDGCGHSLLQWILTIRPDTFVVMFSGFDDTDNVWMAIEAGAKGFITKPFDPEKLLFFIEQCRVK